MELVLVVVVVGVVVVNVIWTRFPTNCRVSDRWDVELVGVVVVVGVVVNVNQTSFQQG